MDNTLLEQVKRMRQAQKEYFHTRQVDWLREAQKRERAVDKIIQEIENQEQNPKLF